MCLPYIIYRHPVDNLKSEYKSNEKKGKKKRKKCVLK